MEGLQISPAKGFYHSKEGVSFLFPKISFISSSYLSAFFYPPPHRYCMLDEVRVENKWHKKKEKPSHPSHIMQII
jgi:hypothetical protein